MTSQPTNSEPDAGLQVFPIAMMSNAFSAITWAFVLGIAGVFATLVIIGFSMDSGGRLGPWLSAIIMAVIFIPLIFMVHMYGRPKCFEVSSEGMVIVWPARIRKLPRGAFTEIRTIKRMELGRMIRKFGVGGIFGQFGWFHSVYMGNLDAYITRNDGMVLIKLRNRRPILITPENPQEFVKALQAAVNSDLEKAKRNAPDRKG